MHNSCVSGGRGWGGGETVLICGPPLEINITLAKVANVYVCCVFYSWSMYVKLYWTIPFNDPTGGIEGKSGILSGFISC